MRARDQSSPEKSTTASIQVSISRDQYPPVIDFPTYEKTIEENAAVNKSIIVRIVARDQDLKVRLRGPDNDVGGRRVLVNTTVSRRVPDDDAVGRRVPVNATVSKWVPVNATVSKRVPGNAAGSKRVPG